MDNSCLVLDGSSFKLRISEIIENSMYMIDKRASNIYSELEHLKNEYSGFVNKCKYN